MQLALVNNQRVEAFKGGKGTCPLCYADTIAKVGPRVIAHWSHASKQNCDPWWENETEWHRNWKNLYPLECREISHIALSGEIHRADIKTPTGIVIEIQHSPMSDAERVSREDFYGNLVWVLDGSVFKQNFYIYHLLPDPKSDLAKDIWWYKATKGMKGAINGMFHRVSDSLKDNPLASKQNLGFSRVYSLCEIESDVKAAYQGHHQFDWVKPRKTWLDAKCPVYIDLGGEHLARLEKYDEYEMPCIRFVSKRKFIHDTMTEANALDIATRFYKLPA